MPERVSRSVLVLACVLGLGFSGCGHVSNSGGAAGQAVEVSIVPTTEPGPAVDSIPGGPNDEAPSVDSIPPPSRVVPDEREGLEVNVLESPHEFDTVIAHMEPRSQDLTIGRVCSAYYEVFAGYRLLNQFSGSEEESVARELASIRLQMAVDLLTQIPPNEIVTQASADAELSDIGRQLVQVRDRLLAAALEAGSALATGEDTRGVWMTLERDLFAMPADEQRALDLLGESASGCMERS